ncbi:hypothetical protein ABZW30_08090 [Kitasatospora sp. NPDC004669]|uniref:hypothetical protein n=1 Tax=Kitasatospora sp. NPDC004669 TaxID=3154555 RepID=UPI0033B98E5E
MTWDIPGSPPYAGVHVQRNLAEGTYQADLTREAIAALAQRWLISRGADPDVISQPPMDHMATDEATQGLERRLRESGDRFRVVNQYTHDEVLRPQDLNGEVPPKAVADDGLVYFFKTWIIAEDTRPEAGQHPVRLFFEDVDMKAHSYTLREGGFRSVDDAYGWTRDIDAGDNPLPPVSTGPSARVTGALQRGTMPLLAPGPTSAIPAPAPAAPRPRSR